MAVVTHSLHAPTIYPSCGIAQIQASEQHTDVLLGGRDGVISVVEIARIHRLAGCTDVPLHQLASVAAGHLGLLLLAHYEPDVGK